MSSHHMNLSADEDFASNSMGSRYLEPMRQSFVASSSFTSATPTADENLTKQIERWIVTQRYSCFKTTTTHGTLACSVCSGFTKVPSVAEICNSLEEHLASDEHALGEEKQQQSACNKGPAENVARKDQAGITFSIDQLLSSSLNGSASSEPRKNFQPEVISCDSSDDELDKNNENALDCLESISEDGSESCPAEPDQVGSQIKTENRHNEVIEQFSQRNKVTLNSCGENTNHHQRQKNVDKDIVELIDYMLDLVQVSVEKGDHSYNKKAKTDKDANDAPVIDLDSDDQSECNYTPNIDPSKQLQVSTPEPVYELDPFEAAIQMQPFADRCFECLVRLEKDTCKSPDLAGGDGEQRSSQTHQLNYIVDNGKVYRLCSDECRQDLSQRMKKRKCAKCKESIISATQGYYSIYHSKVSLCSESCLELYDESNLPDRRCHDCKTSIKAAYKNLKYIFCWQTYEFCSPTCMERTQSLFGANCEQCLQAVNRQVLAKYAVRFGDLIRQFCSGTCLEEYKKHLKICCFCQGDISSAEKPLKTTTRDKPGSDGQVKMKERFYCDMQCLNNYSSLFTSTANDLISCSQCCRLVAKKFMLAVALNGASYNLCSTYCVSAFRYANDIELISCDNCNKFDYYNTEAMFLLRFAGTSKRFCTRRCQHAYMIKHRKIEACVMCKVKKYNFDLIEMYCRDVPREVYLFCSLNCMYVQVLTILIRRRFPDTQHIPCSACLQDKPVHCYLEVRGKNIHGFCSMTCCARFQALREPSMLRVGTAINLSVSNKSVLVQPAIPPARVIPNLPRCVPPTSGLAIRPTLGPQNQTVTVSSGMVAGGVRYTIQNAPQSQMRIQQQVNGQQLARIQMPMSSSQPRLSVHSPTILSNNRIIVNPTTSQQQFTMIQGIRIPIPNNVQARPGQTINVPRIIQRTSTAVVSSPQLNGTRVLIQSRPQPQQTTTVSLTGQSPITTNQQVMHGMRNGPQLARNDSAIVSRCSNCHHPTVSSTPARKVETRSMGVSCRPAMLEMATQTLESSFPQPEPAASEPIVEIVID